MKRFAKLAVASAIALVSVFGLAGCKDEVDMLTKTPNEGISAGVPESVGNYSSVAYFEQERPTDVKIAFETDKIQKVSFKYNVLDSDDYKFKNDTLTIKKRVFENESAGDKRVRVFVDDMYTEITVRVVTKVIYTADDFNSIRTNLNGVYVLGADIDFGGGEFWPIGKPINPSESTGTFEGIFDGMGHSVKNLVINSYNYVEGEDNSHQGPSLGSPADNVNASCGIFMSTGGSAQIINTSFINISVEGRWLFGTVVGANGGLIKNCYVTTTLTTHGDYANRAGGIVGINGSGDAAGRIENCLCIYSQNGGDAVRGIADFNNGIIKNCYAATKDSYVFHIGYDSDLGKVPDDFDYDDFITVDNWRDTGVGWYPTLPALPGALDWNTTLQTHIFYKAGDIINSDIVRKEFFLDPANFTAENGWDTDIWNFTYGAYPSLKVQSR